MMRSGSELDAEANLSYDDVFLGILQKEQKIDKFLDSVFNFLCRRFAFHDDSCSFVTDSIRNNNKKKIRLLI